MRRKIGFSFFALGLLASATAAWAQTVTVNAGTTYQTISGFGAASVWCESKISAAIANVLWTDDSTLAPASQVNGHVGLSIIRIIIDDGGSGNWWRNGRTSARPRRNSPPPMPMCRTRARNFCPRSR